MRSPLRQVVHAAIVTEFYEVIVVILVKHYNNETRAVKVTMVLGCSV